MFQYINLAVLFISLLGSTSLMRAGKEEQRRNQQVQDILTSNEKKKIWLYSILNPIVAWAVFYFGWRKILPGKAKHANNISVIAFIIDVVIGIILLSLFTSRFINY